MRHRLTLIGALVTALLMGIASSGSTIAHAQSADGAMRAAMRAARPFAEKGFELYSQGKYVAAITEFERAETHFHAPTHLLYIARSQVGLKQLVEAKESYDRIIAERFDSRAPPAFHRAQADAVAELDQLRPRIPEARIEIRGVDSARASVSVDGSPLGAIPDSLALNPGEHRFVAEAPGMPSTTVTVALQEGDRRVVLLDFAPDAGDDTTLLVPALISFGVGGLALIIGSATGIASLAKTSDIDDQCNDIHCPVGLEDEADEAKALGHTSTAMFIFSGLAVAAGTTLLLLDDRGGGDQASATSLSLQLGPTAFRLDGRF